MQATTKMSANRPRRVAIKKYEEVESDIDMSDAEQAFKQQIEQEESDKSELKLKWVSKNQD